MKIFTTLLLVIFTTTSYSQLTAVSINLYTYHNGTRDLETGIAAFYSSQLWSDSVDLNDAPVLTNPFSETMAIKRNGYLLASEKRSTFDTIPLKMWGMHSGIYELQFKLVNMPHNMFLQHIPTGTLYPIVDSFIFSFNSTCTGNEDYRIIFMNVLAIDTTPPVYYVREAIKEIKAYPNPTTNQVSIKLPDGKYTVRLCNQIKRNAEKVATFQMDGFIAGIYYATVEDNIGRITVIKIIKL